MAGGGMEWTKQKPLGGSKYGLQLKKPAAKKPQLKKPLPFSLGDEDDEYTVEDDIARQAFKKQSAHEVDLQIKQALEQDAAAFDYDGIYERMKGEQAKPIREDRAKREPKYIKVLMDKAKVRAVEHEMAYERKLAKEREKEDHLYGDKDTFVTSAYKKKLMEVGKWKEEERLRELREKAHEVSGKKDLSDFYRNLLKHNVAFGAGRDSKDLRPDPEETPHPAAAEPGPSSKLRQEEETSDDVDDPTHRKHRSREEEAEPRSSPRSKQNTVEDPEKVSSSGTKTNMAVAPEIGPSRPPSEADKPLPSAPAGKVSKEDAVAAAKERYLARKRQKKD